MVEVLHVFEEKINFTEGGEGEILPVQKFLSDSLVSIMLYRHLEIRKTNQHKLDAEPSFLNLKI